MKSFLYSLLSLFIGLSITSCLRDSNDLGDISEPDNKYDTISFFLSFSDLQSIESKAPIKIAETAISNFNIFLFNEFGALMYQNYISSSNKVENVSVHKNKKHKIYIIANAGKEIKTSSENELLKLSHSINNISQISDISGACLMSGVILVNSISEGQYIDIPLTRAVAKVLIKCDYSGLNPGVNLNIKSVQILNAASSVAYFSTSKAISSKNIIMGEIRDDASLTELAKIGIPFYIYENMQGNLTPSATSNKDKANLLSPSQRELCSYFYMVYDYKDGVKQGTIKYSGYLGELGNCNVERNKQYTYKVSFIGNASRDEMSVSVDNSQLKDRVREINISPNSHTFTSIGSSIRLTANVVPNTAYDTRLLFKSSNTQVASVDNTGLVIATGNGECDITVTSVENDAIYTVCKIKVIEQTLELSQTDKTIFISESFNLSITKLSPSDASNINYSASDNSILDLAVNSNKMSALITGKREGTAIVNVSSGSLLKQCTVNVLNSEIDFLEKNKIMYDGEISTITFNKLSNNLIPTIKLSNPSIIDVIEVNSSNIRIHAKVPGNCTVTASVGNKSTTCKISVELLRIELPTEITCYRTFNSQIDYTIYPAHARNLQLLWEYGNSNSNNYYSFVNIPYSNNIVGKTASDSSNPSSLLKVSFYNYPNKSYNINVKVKEAISIRELIKAQVNFGNTDLVEALNIDTSPQANVIFEWEGKDGSQDIIPNIITNTIKFPNPNGANGEYVLRASVIGDNGVRSYAKCTIEVYETIYLVGVSKSIDRERIKYDNSSRISTYRYTNEIVAKWLANPYSKRFKAGEIGSNLFPFYYLGKQYTDDHTNVMEELDFDFEYNENVALAWNTGYIRGIPSGYIEYYALNTDNNGYQKSEQYGYIYVLSRAFGGGFTDGNISWQEIFSFIY